MFFHHLHFLKKAEKAAKSRDIIVTARSNNQFESPFGSVTPTNRDDIVKFLQSAGAGIDGGQVFPVGSSDPEAKVEIIEGSGGVFDVTVDGKLIFSKKETDRFPEENEVYDLISS